ncbi:MAG: bifunctional phosphoglucose/phosphomannose isomerase [Flavobacteriales bacterium]|nr:bifunctional phosphoglucose/phosphomannose isomerase [Flavobacteriales bacterium]|tara:strand:- start:9436 stop:10422 length:987 start_codon:yes stop_codon:yes gene_type:complete
MRKHIEGFIQQLEDAFSIGEKSAFSIPDKKLNNVLILGVGGSGIGGTVVAKTALLGAGIPVMTCNDYHIPEYVDENTLVIACSYSGNTEETLTALKKCQNKGTEIAAVTSGGELKRICEEHNYNHIIIPGGNPPRTCLGYSLTEQFFILIKYKILPEAAVEELKSAIQLLKENESSIIEEAKTLADNLFGKLPVIYSTDKFEPVSIRFRQQLNENSKELCWHQKFPEMNHNEIVGWASGNSNLSVVMFRNHDDYYRTQERMEFMKKVILDKGSTVTEIHSKGNSFIEKALYLIYLTDWASLFIAEKKEIDPVEIRVIDALKDHLATIK